MTSTARMLKEIASVRGFFSSRQANSSDGGLQKSFADSILMMLGSMTGFGPSEAAQINAALEDTPYGSEHSARIMAHMDTLLHASVSRSMKDSGSGSAASTRGGSGRSKQMLKHWCNYFTGTEVAVLQDQKKSMHIKMTILVERGLKIGLVDPDEQAHKWALAFLLTCHYAELPPSQLLYDKLQDLKATWQSERRDFFLERVDEYPEMPSNLPAQLFAEAYTADDPSLPVVVVGINKIADSIPLRASSKLLKPTKAVASMRRDHEQAFQACTPSVVAKPPRG